jgi:hypothetical protein
VDAFSLTSDLLRVVNDETTVRDFGTGWLVRTPFSYSDGDVVTVFVEPYNTGVRVSDRAEAVDRLTMWGVDPSTGKAQTAIERARQSAQLIPIASEATETATFGEPSQVGRMIFAVAETALRTEQLRWLARDVPVLSFDERLSNRVGVVARSHDWKYARRAPMDLVGGRSRRITAAVTGARGTAWVQAVGDADKERSTEHCFYLFDRSLAPQGSRIAALAGDPDGWSSALTSDLEHVGVVTFFEDPSGLEAELERIIGSVPALG